MKKTKLPFIVILVWLLTACNISESDAVYEYTINFHLGAWQDIDANGIWDEYEAPIEGVKFHMYGPILTIWGQYPYLTNSEGWVTFTALIPGKCSNKEFTIVADPPESYQPTTPIFITTPICRQDFEAQFGFRIPK
jgi:hypothetical protein